MEMLDPTINRHGGNAASVAAFASGAEHHETARQTIFALIQASSNGMTSKEISGRTGWALHKFSGRITQLKADGMIYGTGERRHGAEVLKIVPSQMALLEVA